VRERVGRDRIIQDKRLEIARLRCKKKAIILGMRESRRLKKSLDVAMKALRDEIKDLLGVNKSF
jgi:hypothetical protein